ncbi:MAG: methionyl-tRNA formyltransferase [Gammaproteobacteria bacterium]|nr:methionyl-tRNA formyltransferase [Gammaproteobacteria bacterium]
MTSRRIRTIYAGTPDFAVPGLKVLLARPEFELVAVYTQPDRPAGRGRRMHASPIKELAVANGLAVEQPERVTTEDAIARYLGYEPQLLVVAAYGLLLPNPFIDAPITAINIHASLLPRWRGAAPIQRALMAGDARTGISIMRVVKKLDAGPVWLMRDCPITDETTGGSLHDTLAELGGTALHAALDLYLAGAVIETVQDESAVTYAAKLGPADREIDWQQPAAIIDRQVRALNPSPAAVTRFKQLEVKVLAGHCSSAMHGATPGTVLSHDDRGIVVAAGTGCYTITELQPAGKQRMSAQSFRNGYGSYL